MVYKGVGRVEGWERVRFCRNREKVSRVIGRESSRRCEVSGRNRVFFFFVMGLCRGVVVVILGEMIIWMRWTCIWKVDFKIG